MRKIIALSLVFTSFASTAGGISSGEIQPYPDYLAAYIKAVVTASCDQVLEDCGKNSIDRAIKSISAIATKGMATNTESYYVTSPL
ncbi:hypothetical protein [Enterobacillus tribolii]|uniref:Uncharacterized protein n=1 Tax=Enterobacillus tribolii TaxID=1487935 RepID=A0A370QQK6_9GAMM|nr:hypothetical protein [Enterobacillus tribolii]RDK90985.1 hypothetical protein C8D90_105271 [Enterobacillus tribolii]